MCCAITRLLGYSSRFSKIGCRRGDTLVLNANAAKCCNCLSPHQSVPAVNERMPMFELDTSVSENSGGGGCQFLNPIKVFRLLESTKGRSKLCHYTHSSNLSRVSSTLCPTIRVFVVTNDVINCTNHENYS